jgi:deoxyribonuclease V
MDTDELVKRYNLDLKKLEQEQKKLAEQLEIKDKLDFKLADKFGAITNVFLKNKIISSIIVCNKDYEIIDRAYSFEKLTFPYIAGFRAYRELPAMISAYNKLSERPDVIFISGYGLIHPRLGLVSHFSLAVGVPCIGISDSFDECIVKDADVFKENKKVGKVLVTKPHSRPLCVSPGNLISIETSYELSKKFINLPHKLPEPLHIAHKYAKEIMKELNSNNCVKENSVTEV